VKHRKAEYLFSIAPGCEDLRRRHDFTVNKLKFDLVEEPRISQNRQNVGRWFATAKFHWAASHFISSRILNLEQHSLHWQIKRRDAVF